MIEVGLDGKAQGQAAACWRTEVRPAGKESISVDGGTRPESLGLG